MAADRAGRTDPAGAAPDPTGPVGAGGGDGAGRQADPGNEGGTRNRADAGDRGGTRNRAGTGNKGRITFFVLAAVLVFYFVLAGSRGALLIREGDPVTVALGTAVLVLPLLGVWFLWRTYAFARDSGRLARELEAEAGLPRDELARTPGGRVDRASADAVFALRRAETEAAPDDWRSWFRLAVAYHDARDTPRARKAMQRAIALHGGRGGGPVGATGAKGPAQGLERD